LRAKIGQTVALPSLKTNTKPQTKKKTPKKKKTVCAHQTPLYDFLRTKKDNRINPYKRQATTITPRPNIRPHPNTPHKKKKSTTTHIHTKPTKHTTHIADRHPTPPRPRAPPRPPGSPGSTNQPFCQPTTVRIRTVKLVLLSPAT